MKTPRSAWTEVHLRNAAHHHRSLVQVEEVVNQGSQVKLEHRNAHDILVYNGSDGKQGVRGLLGDVPLDVLLEVGVVPMALA
jgi:hypothetical protein